MATDIPPLAPVNPSPLVRKKRHYHSEHQHQNPQGSPQDEAPESDAKEQEQGENNHSKADKSSDNAVNQDEKHATVKHLDEYV